MFRNLVLYAVCAATIAGAASTAHAGNIRPVGDAASLASLQSIFNELNTADGLDAVGGVDLPGDPLDAILDQLSVGLFSPNASGASIASFVIEVSGNATTNSMGIYDASNSANAVELFAGADGAGKRVLIEIQMDGSVYLNFSDTGVDFQSSVFGFYMDNGTDTWFSEDDLNPGGSPQALIYSAPAPTMIKLPNPVRAGLMDNDDIIVAFEDLRYVSGKSDFDDLVFFVSDVTPVPEPGTLALFGAAAVGLVCFRRRRRS